MHCEVKNLSAQRYIPIYFTKNHLFSNHSPAVISYLIFFKFSPLKAKLIRVYFDIDI